MIDTPNENVKLTFDQLQAIDVTEKRLANLESEVNIATKSLRVAKLDADRATKENIYQNELLAIVTAQVAEKQNRATQLDEQILAKSDELAVLSSKIVEFTAKKTAEEMLLKDREDAVSILEIKLQEDRSILDKIEENLHTNIEEFNKKVANLKEVIGTF
jgi:hypothetical protein